MWTGDPCEDESTRSLLGLHALGRLGEADRERVLTHVDGCAGCRGELAELAGVTSALDLLSAADIAELLVADLPMPAPGSGEQQCDAEPSLCAEPSVRVACRFHPGLRNQRFGRGGPADTPARRSGTGWWPAPELPPRER